MSNKPSATGRDFNFERFLARVVELNRRPLDEATRKVEMSRLCLDMARTDTERREAKEMLQVSESGLGHLANPGLDLVQPAAKKLANLCELQRLLFGPLPATDIQHPSNTVLAAAVRAQPRLVGDQGLPPRSVNVGFSLPQNFAVGHRNFLF